jgi:hypothetical protein
MKIERARSDTITARYGNICLTATMEQWSYSEDSQAIEAANLGGNDGAVHVGGSNRKGVIIEMDI